MKRIFDIISSIIGLLFVGWLIIILFILTSIDTLSNGFFIQERIGQWGKVFKIIKLKTMKPVSARISSLGAFLRKSKLDELPQLWNVLKGDMSFVGPRPDIAGYYDVLEGEDRKILALKPGLTCDASLKYANEEKLLKKQSNALEYNDQVLFPDKVKMNLDYYYHRSFLGDIKIIWETICRK